MTRQPVPPCGMAAYARLLLAGLRAYGGQRSPELPALPRWRGHAGRPFCLDLVTTLRGQFAARPEVLADWDGASSLARAVEQAAA